ncbi:MAG: PA0069 family radical SAM protein [Acidobacteria bacterium]|nr:PA0069 family radical SAM protein [Acidobacteriota bacterium]MCA1640465.1 PA0069 family radical SAM protein [Acidobacteriota bacterium]
MRHVENPPNPWLDTHVEWIGEPPESRLEVFEEEATRTIINKNDSPDVGFDYSVNVYRGCQHACTYCFSRPTHEYLGFGAGTDFERKIVVKVNAAKLLRAEMMKPSWKGSELVFSFTSDPYLPLEAHYKLTRACLEVCLEFRNPVGIVTKSALVRRDADVLAALAREASAAVFFTIGFVDNKTARALEPHAPSPDSRFKAMEELARAGVPVGLGIAPVTPGLNDPHIPQLLKRAKECGARYAFINLLRLPGSVAPYFEQRLREELPDRADRILNRVREVRGGKLNVSEFGKRMTGEGEYWKMIEQSFRLHARRLGFNEPRHAAEFEPRKTFRRPTAQGSLFD